MAARLARLTADDEPASAEVREDPIADASRALRRQQEHLARRPMRQQARLPSSKGRRRELARKRQAGQAKDDRYLARLAARMDVAGQPQHASSLKLIPGRVWTMVQCILADPTGQAARIYMARQRNKVAVGAIREAALVPGRDGARYTWADWRARAIAALGLALMALANRTARHQRYSSMVWGVTQGALAALLRNPFDRQWRPSRTTMAGTHRFGATYRDGQVGYLTALEQAGFGYGQQLPIKDVRPGERWVNRRGETWSSNRYWIVTAQPTIASDDEVRARLLELHERGWSAPDELIERAPERYTAASRRFGEDEAQPP